MRSGESNPKGENKKTENRREANVTSFCSSVFWSNKDIWLIWGKKLTFVIRELAYFDQSHIFYLVSGACVD